MSEINILMPVTAYRKATIYAGIVYLAGQVAEDSSLNAYEQRNRCYNLSTFYWKKAVQINLVFYARKSS